jgi:TetR/AcrR family transcriptional regulator, cholesterol catabolism regulator
MPPRGTVGTNSRNKRAEIQRTAAAMFRASSFSATSIDALASAIHLNKGTLYYYYPSKTDILFDVIIRALESLSAGLLKISTALPADEQIRAIIALAITRAVEFPDEMAVYFQERPWLKSSLYPNQVATVSQHERHFAERLDQALTAGETDGLFREVDHVAVRYAIVGMISNLPAWHHPGGRLSQKQVAAHFTDLVLNGLMATAPQAARSPADGHVAT